MCIHGVLERLSGEFMSRQMIFLAVGDRGGGVGVRRKVVKFRKSIVRALWHRVLLIAALTKREATVLCGNPLWEAKRGLWVEFVHCRLHIDVE